VNVKNTTVVKDVVIDMGDTTSGAFHDTLQIDNLNAYRNLVLYGGQGKHSYSIRNTIVWDNLFARLGGGEDGIEIANTTIGDKTDLDLGDGNDSLKISDSSLGATVNMQLGGGDDTLTMTNTTGGDAIIDGGDSVYDHVFRTNANFRSLMLFGFEPFNPFTGR